MGQSAPLNFLQIINAPVARSPHDTGRHVLTTRLEPGWALVCEPLPLRLVIKPAYNNVGYCKRACKPDTNLPLW